MAWTSEGFVIRLWPPLNPPHLLRLQHASPPQQTTLPIGGQTPLAPVPSLFCFPQARAPFSLYSSSKAQLTPTSSLGLPSQMSPQHWPSWHRDAHTVISTVCYGCHSLSHNRLWATEIIGLCPIYPQPPQHPTQELPFKIQCFPSAKILIPDFLPWDHPPSPFPHVHTQDVITRTRALGVPSPPCKNNCSLSRAKWGDRWVSFQFKHLFRTHSQKSGIAHEAVGLSPQGNKTLSKKHHAARLLPAWTATWAQAGTTDSNCSSLGPSRWAEFWLFSEWITNKDVLHNTWNCTQCYLPAWMVGRGRRRMGPCIWMTESLPCSPETTSILFVSYTPNTK